MLRNSQFRHQEIIITVEKNSYYLICFHTFIILIALMASVLSSFFSRDPRHNFSYELPSDENKLNTDDKVKELFFAMVNKKGNSAAENATCFWTRSAPDYLRVQSQKLKTLRHPNILVYLDSIEIEDTFYLVTEFCKPLRNYLSERRLTGIQRELFISWGLYQILNCLKFLHNEAKISHNNLKDGIFVTVSGDWKLLVFHDTEKYRSSQTDFNDLADVIKGIFSNGLKHAGSVENIPRKLLPLFRSLDSRRNIALVDDLLKDCRSPNGFMRNKFVDTLLFLEEFQLKENNEKLVFFRSLNESLDLFPDDIAKNKILPKLIHSYEYGNAGPQVLVPLFKLGRFLDEEEYQLKIIPCLVKLFSSSDRTTRVKLLERIDEFASHLRPQVINEKIYSQLITGFTDTNPAVRESTVKAIASIANKLNYYNLNTDLMKHLAKVQGSDDQPGIRTNATICLGKIASNIDPSHRRRILISAFTRALKDPFPPARIAGIVGICATQNFYYLAEAANQIMPALSPISIDQDKQVRDHALRAMKGFLEKLQKASDSPELIPELESQVKIGASSNLLSSDKVPQWAGWAIKALSGKFYKSTLSTSPGLQAPPTTTASTTIVDKPTIGSNITDEITNDPLQTMEKEINLINSKIVDTNEETTKTVDQKNISGWGELDFSDDDDGGNIHSTSIESDKPTKDGWDEW